MTTSTGHLNATLRLEIDRLLSEIELDYRLQKAAANPEYEIPYHFLSRLVAVGLPTVDADSRLFIEALIEFVGKLPDSVAQRALNTMLDPAKADPSGLISLYRDTRWQSMGCPAINLEGRLAASLMLSECPDEILNELQPPWDAFVIRLPQGLIEFDDISYTHVLVHRYHTTPPAERVQDIENLPEDIRATAEKVEQFMIDRQGFKWGVYGFSGEMGHLQSEARLGEHLGRAPRVYLTEPELPIGDPRERVIALFARLAIGVSLLCQSEGALRRRSTKKKERGPSRMGKGPVTTEYVLGQKIKVGFDCIDAVKTWVRGDVSALPAIQWLVRGHWRNQPVGPGRVERKRIWIMPHWKGPQEAPRLFREYEFNASLSAPSEALES